MIFIIIYKIKIKTIIYKDYFDQCWVPVTLCLKSPSVLGFVASLPVYLLFKYISQCILPGFVFAAMRHLNWGDETGWNALFYTYLNNRWTGKDATKPCALGHLGHSELHLGFVNFLEYSLVSFESDLDSDRYWPSCKWPRPYVWPLPKTLVIMLWQMFHDSAKLSTGEL